jgi:assimilatory nitrate reductase catalytic subunit
VHEIEALLGLNASESLMQFSDPRRGVFKTALVEDNVVTAVSLCNETAAQEWIRNMMVEGASATALRPWILAPVSTPPRGTLSRGRIVCNCLDVAEAEIQRALKQGADFDGLQATLRCGTQCGSCLPEVRRMCTAPQLGAQLGTQLGNPVVEKAA